MEAPIAPNGIKALARALDLLQSLAAEGDSRPLACHAAALAIPPSTAHRLAATFVDRGLLARIGRGRYVDAGGLADLARQPLRRESLATIARAPIAQLVRETNFAAHLGVWDQDMVQYLVRIAPLTPPLFTREGGRLEGYCSAIGKMLLAYLPASDRDAYLASGPFVALTPHTITDPISLAGELAEVRATGIATDREEIAEGLNCIAIPMGRRDGRVIAAISLSGSIDVQNAEPALRRCAETISHRIG